MLVSIEVRVSHLIVMIALLYDVDQLQAAQVAEDVRGRLRSAEDLERDVMAREVNGIRIFFRFSRQRFIFSIILAQLD